MTVKLSLAQPAAKSEESGKASAPKKHLKTNKMNNLILRLRTQLGADGCASRSKPIPIQGRSLTHPAQLKNSLSVTAAVSGPVSASYLGTSSTQFNLEL